MNSKSPEEMNLALGGKMKPDGTFEMNSVDFVPESADEFAKLHPDGPLTDPAEAIPETILATTPKIIIVGTGPTAIRNAMEEIAKYYNGQSPMKVVLVDHEKEPIAESTIEEMRAYDNEGKLQPFIKTIAAKYIESGKGRLFGGMGKSDSQRVYNFSHKKKKSKLQKQSRKANRRKK